MKEYEWGSPDLYMAGRQIRGIEAYTSPSVKTVKRALKAFCEAVNATVKIEERFDEELMRCMITLIPVQRQRIYIRPKCCRSHRKQRLTRLQRRQKRQSSNR